MAEKFEGGTPPKNKGGRPPKKRQRPESIPNISFRGGLTDFNRGMITALFHLDVPMQDIVELTHVPRSTVARQVECIIQGNPYGDPATPQNKDSPEHVKARRELVISIHKEDPRRTANEVRDCLFARHDIDVSHRTCVRDHKAVGARHLVSIVEQKLSPPQVTKRQAFAKEVLTKHPSEDDPFWAKIVFSDESYRGCTPMDCTQWVFEGEERGTVQKTRWDAKIHVWGYIGVGIRGLYLVEEGAVTGDTYKERLRSTLGKATWRHQRVWQQDNARPHVKRCVTEWFENNKIECIDWPPNSPDLSPIENAWSRLWKEALRDHPEDAEELWKRCKQVWFGWPQQYIDGLVLSFRDRCVRCRDEEGRSISAWY